VGEVSPQRQDVVRRHRRAPRVLRRPFAVLRWAARADSRSLLSLLRFLICDPFYIYAVLINKDRVYISFRWLSKRTPPTHLFIPHQGYARIQFSLYYFRFWGRCRNVHPHPPSQFKFNTHTHTHPHTRICLRTLAPAPADSQQHKEGNACRIVFATVWGKVHAPKKTLRDSRRFSIIDKAKERKSIFNRHRRRLSRVFWLSSPPSPPSPPSASPCAS
jgi:hypothetical protein